MRIYKRNLYIKWLSGILLMLTILFYIAIPQEAQATVCKDDTGQDAQGFTVAIVFCIRSSITDALTGTHLTDTISTNQIGYLTQVINFMQPYEYAAMLLAITLFGVKLMTVSVEEFLKEGVFLLFRIGFVAFFLANLGGANQTTLYHSDSGNGLYGAAVDFSGELVSFVNAGFQKAIAGCAVSQLPDKANPVDYMVWQGFDCIFHDMLAGGGAASGITTFVLVLVASLFSGAFGLAIFIGAITSFVMVLLSLMRATYTVILAYFILALLFMVGPIVIPLLVFDSKFTKSIFWNWIGMITSTILQPLFIIGFLSFFIMIDWQFINGTFGPYTFPDGTVADCITDNAVRDTDGNMKSLGNGKGVCSFKQIFSACQPVQFNSLCRTPLDNPNWTPDCSNEGISCIQAVPIFNLDLNATCPPGGKSALCNAVQAGLGATPMGAIISLGADVMDSVLNKLLRIAFFVPKLYHFPLLQLFVALTAFIIINFTMMDLMKVMPALAQQMTISVGLGLMKMAQVPMEGAIATVVKTGNNAAKANMAHITSAGGKNRGFSGLGSVVKSTKGGARGNLGNLLNKLIG